MKKQVVIFICLFAFLSVRSQNGNLPLSVNTDYVVLTCDHYTYMLHANLLTVSKSTKNRILYFSNSRFNVYGSESDSLACDTAFKVLNKNYDRLADSMGVDLTELVTLNIYPDLQTFHDAIGWSDAPDWVVGIAGNTNEISIVSPYNPGPVHNFASIIKVVTHELVHLFVHKKSNGCNIPVWVNEGTAEYYAYQTPTINNIRNLVSTQGGKPTLSFLNDGNTFGNVGGYQYSYTIAEYITTHFPHGKLAEFIASCANYTVLGFADEPAFQVAWHHFLDEHYLGAYSIDVISKDFPVSFYPNPASDHISVVTNSECSNCCLLIYNSSGQLVKEINSIQTSCLVPYVVDVSDLTNGLYRLFFKQGQKIRGLNLIVQQH